MKKVSIDSLKEALKKIVFPELDNQNLIQLDIVTSLTCDEKGKVLCVLEVPPMNHHAFSSAREAASKMLKGVAGVVDATVVLTGSKKKIDSSKIIPSKEQLKKTLKLDHIKHIIAIGSGKGGVGKSTVTVNLAAALTKEGYRVGLLDADIQGPSLPKMLGFDKKPEKIEGEGIIPLQRYGIKYISMGLFIPENQPLIWRGPMVQSAVFQMIKDVKWATKQEPIDYLLVDLPPGTGDIHMTVCQSLPLSGAIVVSTPQDLALMDARRAYRMFEKLKIKVLGLIENMSVFECPHCQEKSYIFSESGVQKEAEKEGLLLLGKLPLDISLRKSADAGMPEVLKNPKKSTASIFKEIITKLKPQILV